MAEDGHWMEKAFSKHKGSFRAIAKRHGRSTKEEAEAVASAVLAASAPDAGGAP